MRHSLRFLWNATKGHRLAPWRSPYLLWRIETYCGVKMTQIGFLEIATNRGAATQLTGIGKGSEVSIILGETAAAGKGA